MSSSVGSFQGDRSGPTCTMPFLVERPRAAACTWVAAFAGDSACVPSAMRIAAWTSLTSRKAAMVNTKHIAAKQADTTKGMCRPSLATRPPIGAKRIGAPVLTA